jgi:dTDP-4-dehydrorhamnose reductase
MTVLVIGHRGMLAQELLSRLQHTHCVAVGKGRPEVDITQAATIRQALADIRPHVVINAAAYTAVDKAEAEQDAALASNRDGAANLAEACKQTGVPLIHLSTDYVFDGTATCPYHEESPAAPLGSYGRSKWEGEEAVRSCYREHLIIRTAWLYGSCGTNFVKTILRLARQREVLRVVADQHGCPTWTRDLADALVDMCQRIKADKNPIPWGTYHLCSAGQTTWYEFAQAIVEEARAFEKLVVRRIEPIPTAAYPTPVRRPANSVLDCSKIQAAFRLTPRPWRESLHEFIGEFYACTSIPPGTS